MKNIAEAAASGGGGGGGGSGLPDYTLADKGKVLTVGEAEPVETSDDYIFDLSDVVAGYNAVYSDRTVHCELGLYVHDDDNVAVLNKITFIEGDGYTPPISAGDHTIQVVKNGETIYKDTITFTTTHDETTGGFGNDSPVIDGPDYGSVTIGIVSSVQPTEEIVIVPQQMLNLRGNTETEIAGDPNGFVVGREYKCVYNMGVFKGQMSDNSGKIGFSINYPTAFGTGVLQVYARNNAVYCKNNESSDMSFFISIQVYASVPKTEPVWKQGDLIVNLTADMSTQTITCDKTAGEIYSANNVTFVIEAPMEAKAKVVFSGINNGEYFFTIVLEDVMVLFTADSASDYPSGQM